MHYWVNWLTHMKMKRPLIVIAEQEDVEVVEWCKDMDDMGHRLELKQLKENMTHICQKRQNPFKDRYTGES
jgi:hypothetical protein